MAYYGNAPADVALVVGSDVITTTEIQDATIATADIANDAITAIKIDDDGTGFQMGSLGLGGAVSGSEKLTVTGTASFSGDITGTLATASQGNITSVGTLSSLTLGGDLSVPQKIIHVGDTNTYLSFGDDSLDIVTGGTTGQTIDHGVLYNYTDLVVAEYIKHDGDTDNYIQFGTDTLTISKPTTFAGDVTINSPSGDTGWAFTLTNSYSSSSDIQIQMGYANSSNKNSGISLTMDDASANEYLLNMESASTSRFRVDGTGRVGIGKVPTKLLHMYGNDATHGNEALIYFETENDGHDGWQMGADDDNFRLNKTGTSTIFLVNPDTSTNWYSSKMSYSGSDSTPFDVQTSGSNDNYFNFRKTSDGGGNASINIIGRREDSNSDVSAVYFKNIFSGTERLIASILANTTDSNGLSGYLRFRTSNGGTSSDALVINHDQSCTFKKDVLQEGNHKIGSSNCYIKVNPVASDLMLYAGNSSAGDIQLYGRRNVNVYDIDDSNALRFLLQTADGVAQKSSGAGDWASTSDARLKKNVKDLSLDALATLNSLRPVEFKWKNEKLHQTPKDSKGNTYGFLADEIQSVMPQMVTESELPEDSDDRKYVDEDGIAKATELGHMASLYIKAIQQLTSRIEALENA